MKYFFYNIFLLTAAVASTVGCSDKGADNGDVGNRCCGRLGIAGVSSAVVVSRAELDLSRLCPGLKVPEPGELKLTLTGKDIAELEATSTGELNVVSRFDYSNEWQTLAEYDKPALFPGTYTAKLEYGDSEAIGPDKPYYRGEVSATVVISDEKSCRVPVAIRNAAVRVTATDNFKNYFFDARFTLEIDGVLYDGSNGKPEYTFTLGDTDRPIFVPAGAKVAVKGCVYRPSQTSDGAGEELPVEVPARVAVAGTLHTFAFTAEAAGVWMEVKFLDHEEGGSDDVELNDGAKL